MSRFSKLGSNLSVKIRLAMLIAIPVLGMLAMSSLVLQSKREIAVEMTRVSDLALLTADVTAYAHALQDEAGASAGFVGAKGDDGLGNLNQLRRTSDEARSKVEKTLRSFDLRAVSAEVNEVLQDGLKKSAGADAVRAGVNRRTISAGDMNNYYTASIVRLLDVSLYAAKAISHDEVARLMKVYAYTLQAEEASSAARANAVVGLNAGRFETPLYATVMAFVAKQEAFMATLELNATADELSILRRTYAGAPIDDTARYVAAIRSAGPNADVGMIKPADWLRVNADRLDLFGKVERIFQDNLLKTAAAVRHDAETGLVVSAGIVVVLMLSTIVLAIVVTSGITGPIRQLSTTMQSLAMGNLETDVVGVDRGDEIGTMAKTVLVFRDKGREARRLEEEAAAGRLREAEQAKRDSERERREAEAQAAREAAAREEELQRRHEAEQAERQAIAARQAEADRLQAEAEARRQAELAKLASAFEAEVGGVVEAVASAATTMHATATGMTRIADRTAQQSLAAASATEQAAANVQTVASASEELSASIREIAGQVANSSRIASGAVDQARRTDQIVQGLAASAEKIGEVISLINSIAGQTNLLALNATIEAARAGDAGKGFAVVASEVKNLANQTAKATDEIGQQIAAVQGATQEAVTAIREIGGVIGQINEIAGTIAAAVEQQGAATNEIARNVEQASAGTSAASANVAEVNQSAREAGKAAGEVLDASGGLSRQADRLRAEVVRFLGQVRTA